MNFKSLYYSESYDLNEMAVATKKGIVNDYSDLEKIFKHIFQSNKMVKTGKSTTTTLFSKTREDSKDSFLSELKSNKIVYNEEITSTSSVPIVKVIDVSGIIHKFIFKPIGGGGANDTTLNSSLTELIPALMFMHKIKPGKNNEETIDKILNANLSKSPVFVTPEDSNAGLHFLSQAKESKKVEEKIDNAMGILQFLNDLNKNKKIVNVWWAYRTKPAGVNSNNAGDLIIKFNDNSLLGVSLKAGSEKSKEPQLNTFVNPIKMYFDGSMNDLKNELWSSVYSKIKGIQLKDFIDNTDTFKTKLREFEEKNDLKYNKMYDEALLIVKNSVLDDFSNKKKFTSFIQDKIIGTSDVPVQIIKAVGRAYHEVHDQNILGESLPKVIGVDVKNSESSKQDLIVTLKLADSSKINMKWSIRTNKPQGSNKLLQVPNLAVKFNGVM